MKAVMKNYTNLIIAFCCCRAYTHNTRAIMSEYDHSVFLGSKTDEDYVAALNLEQSLDFHTFITDHLPAPASRLPANDIRHTHTELHFGKTPNNVFIAHRQTLGAESRHHDPDGHYLATCRKIGQQMLREQYEILEVRYHMAYPGRMDRIIAAKSMHTSRLAVLEMGYSALWIETNEDGDALPLPLKPCPAIPLLVAERLRNLEA